MLLPRFPALHVGTVPLHCITTGRAPPTNVALEMLGLHIPLGPGVGEACSRHHGHLRVNQGGVSFYQVPIVWHGTGVPQHPLLANADAAPLGSRGGHSHPLW